MNKKYLISAILVLLSAGNCFADNFTVGNAIPVIEEALIKAEAGNEVKAKINNASDNQEIANAAGRISAEIDNLTIDKTRKTWQANLLLKTDDKNLAPIALAGRYEEIVQIPVLKRTVKSDEIISEEDIIIDNQTSNRIRNNTIKDIGELVGKSPKRTISGGRPIRIDEIAAPIAIKKGSRVTLLYQSGNLAIKTIGEAMENGSKGDLIKVKNIASKSILQGKVESPDIVRITSAENIDE